MSELPPDHDDAVKQAQWLWDVAYKHCLLYTSDAADE